MADVDGAVLANLFQAGAGLALCQYRGRGKEQRAQGAEQASPGFHFSTFRRLAALAASGRAVSCWISHWPPSLTHFSTLRVLSL